MTLPTHPLGRTGLQITRVGFHDTSISAIAIAWTLAWPGISGAIVGARTPKQVDGWVGAASIHLTPQDLDGIAAAIQETGAGIGPTTARAARLEVAR